MSTSIIRVIRNAYRIGFKEYMAQMMTIGDTKAGTLVGVDRFGNKFYENKDEDEIHLRTRWVMYKEKYYDVSQLEPGWHGWLGYLVDTPPNALDAAHTSVQKVPKLTRIHNGTGTPDAYVPYSTVKPKFQSWTPTIKERV